jgi:hypothetical protein
VESKLSISKTEKTKNLWFIADHCNQVSI